MSCALCEWHYADDYGEYVGCVLNGPHGEGCADFELAHELMDDSCPQVDVMRTMLSDGWRGTGD